SDEDRDRSHPHCSQSQRADRPLRLQQRQRRWIPVAGAKGLRRTEWQKARRTPGRAASRPPRPRPLPRSGVRFALIRLLTGGRLSPENGCLMPDPNWPITPQRCASPCREKRIADFTRKKDKAFPQRVMILGIGCTEPGTPTSTLLTPSRGHNPTPPP